MTKKNLTLTTDRQMGKEWQGPVGWLCWLRECLRRGYAEATRGRELESEIRNAHLFSTFWRRRDLCRYTYEYPARYQSLHWLREMPTRKNIYENLIGSAEWLRMPTRCCKYHKFAYADSVGVPFLTNSFHGKKKRSSVDNSNLE